MTKTTSTLLWIGGGVAAWYLISRVKTLNGLNFVARGLSVVGGAVQILIGVQNPNSSPLAFNSLAANLYVNGNALGNVASFTPTIIQPNAETQIPVLITPNYFGIAAGVINLLEGNQIGGVSAVLQGTANIENTGVPVNLTFVQ